MGAFVVIWAMVIAAVDAVARETILFAGIGFFIGGLDDLVVDVAWLWLQLRRRLTRRESTEPATLDRYPRRPDAERIAVFIAAWDEATVIGAMLTTALARFDHANYRLYVGTYPNDRATIDIVAAVAATDARVRLVIGADDGPTTKADCLNAVWRALLHDEERGEPRAKAVMLHDAEDVVDSGELRIVDMLIDRHWVVQLPVLPLVVPGSRLISGHYLDEFAESHTKQMVVRQALGAGLPLAGVGCAMARPAIDRIAALRDGSPFDAGSLTEDYELGLQIAAMGGSGVLARVRDPVDGRLVAVRAYFPASLDAAVKQKARWMTGIALAGWDRAGWSGALDWREHWMRMRDRRAPLSVLVLTIAYLALVAWGMSVIGHAFIGRTVAEVPASVAWLLRINAVLLVWRLASRALFTGLAYGPVEALWSLPRALVGNLVSLLAARRAVTRYVGMLRGAAPQWDKTAHVFPDDSQATGV